MLGNDWPRAPRRDVVDLPFTVPGFVYLESEHSSSRVPESMRGYRPAALPDALMAWRRKLIRFYENKSQKSSMRF